MLPGIGRATENDRSTMSISALFKVSIALLLAFFAVEKLRVQWTDKRVAAHAAAQHSFAEIPSQESTSDAAFAFKGYEVRPLATFQIRARVLSREDYYTGREADLSPTDLALGWKRMADPAVYKALSITQGGRWYRYSWRNDPPLPPQEIMASSANMHMIPADAAVERALKKVRKEAFVRITGKLVAVSHPNGWRWTSSLSRTDSGAGACELVFVESVEVEP